MQFNGFKVIDELYNGTRFSVYRAIDSNENSFVLKVLHKDKHVLQGVLSNEYEKIKSIQSEHIIKAIDYIETSEYSILVLEDIMATDLRQIIKEPMQISDFLELAIKICSGIRDIHRNNCIHKDINPANIIWNRETGLLKIIDFDISSRYDVKITNLDHPNTLKGTLPYLSPEQTGRMNRTIDQRTDLYSLGVTFYELLTGQLPFQLKTPLDIIHSHLAVVPQPPSEINKKIPEKLSSIILKLLSKEAGQRYQTAEALKNDLKYILDNINAPIKIEGFKIAESDYSGKLHISEKLYGRENELNKLSEKYDEVKSGNNSLVLISGYSGVGKTSLIQELHKVISAGKGYFIDGKFEQFEQNIPYSGVRNAFQKYVKIIFSESEEKLNEISTNIKNAVGAIGKILTDIIPEIEILIGKQPDIPDLTGQEALLRFNFVIQRFVQSIATPENPIVLFLDDLQWADLSSLELIELLATDNQIKNILIIGTWRSNEVSDQHPLIAAIDTIKGKGIKPTEIKISDINKSDVYNWLLDTFNINYISNDFNEFVSIIYENAQGNPFFTIQLLNNLYFESYIQFDSTKNKWHWDLDKIKKHSVGENVIDLLLQKIDKLHTELKQFLHNAACIGSEFPLNVLSDVSEIDKPILNHLIESAIIENIIVPLDDNNFAFIHDRVYQVIYSSISIDVKNSIHFKVGNIILEKYKDQYSIFDIVEQFNLSSFSLDNNETKFKVANLNIEAAIKSLNFAAHKPAFTFAQKALQYSSNNIWSENYEIALKLYQLLVETSYLCNEFEDMDKYMNQIDENAANLEDRYSVCEFNILSLNGQGKFKEAVKLIIKLLQDLNVDILDNTPTTEMVQLQEITVDKIHDLIHIPQMTQANILIAMRIFINSLNTFYIGGPEHVPAVSMKTVSLILKYGYCPEAPFFLSFHGASLFIFFKDFDKAYAFSNLAYNLSNTRETNKIAKIRSDILFATYTYYFKSSFNKASDFFKERYQPALVAGDFEYASYSLSLSLMYIFNTNNNLIQIQQKASQYLQLVEMQNQIIPVAWIVGIIQFIDSLAKGNNNDILLYNSESFICNKVMNDRIDVFILNLKILYALLIGDDIIYKEIRLLEDLYNIQPIEFGSFHYNMFVFYSSLALIQSLQKNNDHSQEFNDKIEKNIQVLKQWASYGPTLKHRLLLVEAEYFIYNGAEIEAFRKYDAAISAARDNEFLCDEAIANECAAKAHMKQGLDKTAQMYFQEAFFCYQRWGATKKVKQLEENYPKYIIPKVKSSGTVTQIDTTLGTTTTSLDISSILKASQTLSGEIHAKRLLEKVLDTIIENAGAQFGTFIQNKDGELIVLAKGSKDESKNTFLEVPLEDYDELPLRVINYVTRSQEPIVFENLSKDTDYVQDEYIAKVKPKSAICYPVTNQGKLSALLYLENNLIEGAFTEKRLNVLNMLSTQIAISLENANLYETLEDKVNQRTEELSKANKEIKQQANELQIKNNQLVELDNFKQAMTNMIVHDLKNPLSSIINVSEDQNAKDQLEKVRHLGHKMLHIVMNVLDVQKYEETVMELKQNNTAVNDIINQAIQQVDYLAKENSVSIIQDPIPDVFVLVDEPIAERILINILTNAIKFAPVGTAVELSVKIDGGNVVFSVKDEGPGIAKEDQALVFEKYAQVKAKKSGNIRSTGLGLTFCKIAVEAHSGTIGITSDIGKGTEVWFTLPKGEAGSQQVKGTQKPGKKAIKKQHYAFTANEKAMLLPVIEKLKSYKLYELTNMLAVLKTIDTESSELISNWCKEIIVCINRFNQKRFNELLDEVVK